MEVLSVGRLLRAVCRHADVRLHPYMSPYLEILSSQHAARILLSGTPNKASVRSLTIHSGIKSTYLNAILFALHRAHRDLHPGSARFSKVTKLVVRCRDPNLFVSSTSNAPHDLHRVLEEIDDMAFVAEQSGPKLNFHSTFGDLGSRIQRLAIHSVDSWPVSQTYDDLTNLVLRCVPTSTDLKDLARLVAPPWGRESSLRRITVIWPPWDDADRPDSFSLTPLQKLGFAQRHPAVTIIEVRPGVGKEDMAAWFVERVQDDSLWNLEGHNRLKL